MKNCLITLFLCAFLTTARSEPVNLPVPIDLSELVTQKMNHKVVYLEDKGNRLTIQDILEKPHDWKRPDSDNVVFDLPRRTLWTHVIFHNKDAQPQLLYIELNPLFLETIVAYDERGDVVDQTGSKVAPTRLDAFPTLCLSVPPGTHSFFISIRSRGDALSLLLRSPIEQNKKAKFDLAIFALLIGGLISLLIYHLFLCATYSNRGYLYYSLFIASTILFTISFTSFHRHLLPAKVFGFATDFWWSAITAEIMFLCMYLFSAELLGLFPTVGRRNKLTHAILILPLTEAASLLLLFATDSPYVLIPIRFSAVLHMFLLPSVAIYLWLRDRKNIISLYYSLSWVPLAIATVLIVAWLSGKLEQHAILAWAAPIAVLAQSLLLSFAAGQRLNIVTQDKIREQNDKLKVMDQLQIYVRDLETRDRVITSFVSSEIVDELDRGSDPLLYEPRNVEKSIIFLDMYNFTTYSESHTTIECHKMLNDYYHVINDTTYAAGGRVDKIIGDAMMIVFDDPANCLRSVVELQKTITRKNTERAIEKQLPIKFGAGVSYGMMLSANIGTDRKFDRTLVGDTVNVASRLQTITRAFAVDILCSKEFVERHPSYAYFRPAGYVLLKGRSQKTLVYELFEHNAPQVVEWKIFTRPHILQAIELELDSKYVETLAVLKWIINRCPRTPNDPNSIIDPTLHSMVNAVEEKMRQLSLRVPSEEETARVTQTLRRAA